MKEFIMGKKWRTEECFVGIVGPSWSGKTVLLTALIDHLNHHDALAFPIGNQKHSQITHFEDLSLQIEQEKNWPCFPYRQYRDRLVHRLWPEKTCDRYEYRCSFQRSDWRHSNAELRFYDLPGERLNDILMLYPQSNTFLTWSQAMFQRIKENQELQIAFQDFQLAVDQNRPEPELLLAYRRGLARARLGHHPYISPSVFLLDTNGIPCRGGDIETSIENRFSGLDENNQFCPLPLSYQQTNPQRVEKFSAIFNHYRDTVVVPWFQGFQKCHALVILVDVLEILAGGTEIYNSWYRLLEDLFHTLHLRNSTLDRAWSGLTHLFPRPLRPVWIKRVAFVATKIDRCHPLDRGHIDRLLQQMTKKYQLMLQKDGITVKTFSVAAVMGTQTDPNRPNERILIGSLRYDPLGNLLPANEKQFYPVSEVPANWPHRWQGDGFSFPDVYPEIPPRLSAPPNQIGLNELFDFICW